MIYLIITENPKKVIKTSDRKQVERITKKIRCEFPNCLIETYVSYLMSISYDKTVVKIKKDSG